MLDLIFGDHEFFRFSEKEICSAYIQGTFNFLAGSFALIAGCLAYNSATRETRRNEKQQKTRCLAFCVHKKSVFRNLMALINKIIEDGETNNQYILGLPTYNTVVNYFIPAKWEDLALLGENLIEEITDLNLKFLEWKRFAENNKMEHTANEIQPHYCISPELTKEIRKQGLVIENKLEILHQSFK